MNLAPTRQVQGKLIWTNEWRLKGLGNNGLAVLLRPSWSTDLGLPNDFWGIA